MLKLKVQVLVDYIAEVSQKLDSLSDLISKEDFAQAQLESESIQQLLELYFSSTNSPDVSALVEIEQNYSKLVSSLLGQKKVLRQNC